MEHFERKDEKPRLEDSEIQREVKDLDKTIEETKVTIEDSFEHLKEMIYDLDMRTAYLQHLENDRSIAELQKEIMGTEGKPKYTPEDVAQVKKEIEEIEREIKDFQGLMDTLTLQNIEFEAIKDEFTKLQEEFKAILTKIDNVQLN